MIAYYTSIWYTICMKENLIHYRTYVCNINYHMVWPVKYRRKILTPEVEKYLQELVQQIADDKGFTVHLFECGEGDHVHCFVSAPPKLSITAIIKYLKGITGRKLFERFPEIRNQLWKGELWNHSYGRWKMWPYRYLWGQRARTAFPEWPLFINWSWNS